MNVEMKNKWIDALRSGQYEQGTGALKTLFYSDSNYRHCCLGVFCEIAGVELAHENEKTGLHLYGKTGDKSSTELPHYVLDSYDIASNQMETLIHMNDVGKPFSEIADYIEEKM